MSLYNMLNFTEGSALAGLFTRGRFALSRGAADQGIMKITAAIQTALPTRTIGKSHRPSPGPARMRDGP